MLWELDFFLAFEVMSANVFQQVLRIQFAVRECCLECGILEAVWITDFPCGFISRHPALRVARWNTVELSEEQDLLVVTKHFSEVRKVGFVHGKDEVESVEIDGFDLEMTRDIISIGGQKGKKY